MDIKHNINFNHKNVANISNDSIVIVSDSDDHQHTKDCDNSSSSDVTILNAEAISKDTVPISVHNSGSDSEEDEVQFVNSS